MLRKPVLGLLAVCLAMSSLVCGCGGASSASSLTPPGSSPDAAPSVVSIAPATLVAGSTAQTITVTGTGFVAASAVNFNKTPLKTTYVSASSLTATIPDAAIAADGTATITVTNPSPGGGTSSPQSYVIAVPTPSVTAISPQAVPAGAAATITLTGTGYEANSIVTWNGAARPTVYVSSTSLQVALSAADVQNFGTGQIGVTNPNNAPTTPVDLQVLSNSPVILGISPSTLSVINGTNVPQQVTVSGSGFASNATALVNGQPVTITAQTATTVSFTLSASYFSSPGSISIVITNPGPPAVTSNTGIISVTAPGGASFAVFPDAAAAGSPDTTITLRGTGFYPDSVVSWNSTALSTTFVDSGTVTAIIPASLLAGFAQANISVMTPELTVQSAPKPFDTFLSLPVNDIVYRPSDGYIYASIPGAAGENLGNTIAAIDPTTGVIQKTIFVGSEPNRLALSDDGTQLFVGLNGAAALRQVDLTSNTAGVQFALGGGPGVYNPPYTAVGLAAVPGQANSVAVYGTDGVVRIFDSGVERARNSSSLGLQTYFVQNTGALAFGSSSSNLYVLSSAVGGALYQLDVDPTGTIGSHQLGGSQLSGSTMQYDNGRLYFSNGTVVNATTGNTAGQFSTLSSTSSSPSPASGPVVSDSNLNRAWIVPNNFGQANQVISYDATTYDPVASLPVTGLNMGGNGPTTNPADLIRWGQNGLAFHTGSQLYVFQGPIVKDNAGSPADLSIAVSSPATQTTGATFNYTLKIQNQGPDTAQGVAVHAALPTSVFMGTVKTTQGACSGAGEIYCGLGSIATGGAVTVTIPMTPTVAGTLQVTASVGSISYDPSASNNQGSASTVVTGSLFSAPPVVTQLAPNVAQAGAGSFTLTVNGGGFSPASTVMWNGKALPTTLASSNQLTATVDTSLTQQLGWASVSVSTGAPGGGQSAALPFTIYQLVNVPANAIAYDPFTRKIYAVLPSTSASVTGNSIVAVNPYTGDVGTPINVGSEPDLLSETTDGRIMYIGLKGAKSIGQFNLLTQTLDATIPVPTPTNFYSDGNGATAMATVPGSDTSLAVALSYGGGIGILDISGGTGTFRSNFSGIYTGTAPVFADATHFYAFDSATTGAEFYRYSIDGSGVHSIDGTTLNGFGGFGGSLAIDGGLVYGGAGGIVNPGTTPPSQIAVLPLGAGPYSTGLFGGGVIPYAAEAKSFNIGVNAAGTALTFLERFDTSHYTLEDQIQLPYSNISSVPGTRWGQDGLAYIIPTASTSPVSSQPSQIMLIRGPFVLPAESVANPAPSITGTDHNTLTVGGSNVVISVTGAGLLPGATAMWNGAARSTSFIDGTHLTVAVPAADLASAGTIALTVQNPGSNTSNPLTVTVQ